MVSSSDRPRRKLHVRRSGIDPSSRRRRDKRSKLDKLLDLASHPLVRCNAILCFSVLVLVFVMQMLLLIQLKKDPSLIGKVVSPLSMRKDAARRRRRPLGRKNHGGDKAKPGDDGEVAQDMTAGNVRKHVVEPADVKWQCTQLEPSSTKNFTGKEAPKHPGYIYLLGRKMSGHKSQRLLLSGGGSASFDVLMEGKDARGAFGVKKALNEEILIYSSDDAFTTRNEMGAPLWLVVYKGENADVAVQHAVDGSTQISPLGGTLPCPNGLNPSDGAAYRKLQASFRALCKRLSLPQRRPFFKRRRRNPGDIALVTLCTQLTVDRLPRLASTAASFAGPVSAAIFVGRYRPFEIEIEEVAAAWGENEAMQRYVDIHVVIDSKTPWFKSAIGNEGRGDDPYPVNILRQESIRRAQTEWIFLAEGDMVSAPNGHELIRSTWGRMVTEEKHHLLSPGRGKTPGVAFVVPSYYAPTKDRDDAQLRLSERVPKSKDELVSAVKDDKVKRMSDVYDSHKELNYQAWEDLRNDTFMSYNWTMSMEPYYIARKETLPPFDPLFMGMGGDKRSQLRRDGPDLCF